jgi:hypothetical protein
MPSYSESNDGDLEFRKENFDIRTLEDEIRADELSARLLRIFYLELMESDNCSPLEAGALAHGADYFLREFLIPDRRENIFSPSPGRVRQFGGNWYIIRNMEPNMTELQGILKAVEAFYGFCRRTGKVPAALAEELRRECNELDFFKSRIEDFWKIEGDGYLEWERACSLKD